MAANLAALELLNQVCVPNASIDSELVDTAARFLASPPANDHCSCFSRSRSSCSRPLGVAPTPSTACAAENHRATESTARATA